MLLTTADDIANAAEDPTADALTALIDVAEAEVVTSGLRRRWRRWRCWSLLLVAVVLTLASEVCDVHYFFLLIQVQDSSSGHWIGIDFFLDLN